MDPSKITIHTFGTTENPRYRATLNVPVPYQRCPGVMGRGTNDGPWVGGEGDTIDKAVAELERAVGRLVIPVWILEPTKVRP